MSSSRAPSKAGVASFTRAMPRQQAVGRVDDRGGNHQEEGAAVVPMDDIDGRGKGGDRAGGGIGVYGPGTGSPQRRDRLSSERLSCHALCY